VVAPPLLLYAANVAAPTIHRTAGRRRSVVYAAPLEVTFYAARLLRCTQLLYSNRTRQLLPHCCTPPSHTPTSSHTNLKTWLYQPHASTRRHILLILPNMVVVKYLRADCSNGCCFKRYLVKLTMRLHEVLILENT
uniref:Uncharacterized protein n=1 Tax=Cucumis melo TaxID=3656 RepID=A0A9I9EGB0_CUCME